MILKFYVFFIKYLKLYQIKTWKIRDVSDNLKILHVCISKNWLTFFKLLSSLYKNIASIRWKLRVTIIFLSVYLFNTIIFGYSNIWKTGFFEYLVYSKLYRFTQFLDSYFLCFEKLPKNRKKLPLLSTKKGITLLWRCWMKFLTIIIKWKKKISYKPMHSLFPSESWKNTEKKIWYS